MQPVPPNEDDPSPYLEHDYDPWCGDYETHFPSAGHPLVVLAQKRMNFLATLEETPFEKGHIIPARLVGDAVAVYVAGTCNEPIVFFDAGQHDSLNVLDPESETIATVDHEVRHAIQESEADPDAEWADEEDAEHGTPFPPTSY